jgi:hypothetical protein
MIKPQNNERGYVWLPYQQSAWAQISLEGLFRANISVWLGGKHLLTPRSGSAEPLVRLGVRSVVEDDSDWKPVTSSRNRYAL